MPHIRLVTNVNRDEFDQDFMNDIINQIAVINGKPAKLFMMSISAGELISMDESQSPAAHVVLASIGKIDESSNTNYAKIFFDALKKKGIIQQRIQITFHDITKQNFAWNNDLISHMFPDPPSPSNGTATEASKGSGSGNSDNSSATCTIL